VFSVEDAAGNSRARERVDGLKKNQAASETRHTGVSALRASPIDRTADHWLTPAAIASRLCEPVRTNAKHKLRKVQDYLTDYVGELTAPGTPVFDATSHHWRVPVFCKTAKGILPVAEFLLDEAKSDHTTWGQYRER
jgi:hypothetical protein